MQRARRSCPASLLAVVAVVLLSACIGAAHADDAAVMRNLNYHCSNLNAPGADAHDEALLRCQTIEDDPEILRLVINQQIPHICQSIQEQCQAPGSDARKARLSNYLTTLSCAERGYTCPSGRGARAGVCDGGNINIVVKAIDEIERAGGVVSRSLRRAVRVYAEACALNRATQTALANVNTEMRAFYDDKYIGCVEAGLAGTVDEYACRAAIDRRWQANSVRAMFDWSSSNSIVTQVTLDAVRRWTGLD